MAMQDDHIHAKAFGKPMSDKFRGDFVEGGVYWVESFKVTKVVEPYRPVSNDLFIKLKWATTIFSVETGDHSINFYKFEFMKFDQLASRLNRHKFLTGTHISGMFIDILISSCLFILHVSTQFFMYFQMLLVGSQRLVIRLW